MEKGKFILFTLILLLNNSCQDPRCQNSNYTTQVLGKAVVTSVNNINGCPNLMSVGFDFKADNPTEQIKSPFVGGDEISVPKSWVQSKSVKIGSTFSATQQSGACAAIKPVVYSIPEIPLQDICF